MIDVPPALLAFGRWQREGRAGRDWIRALPTTVGGLLTRWGLVPDGEAMNGYNGMALPVRRDREPLVLKVSWPQEAADCHEALALAAWDGRGAVRLLAHSPAEGALLLERAHDRTPLREVVLADAVPAAGVLLRRLAVPAPPGLRHLTDLAAELAAGLPGRWRELGRPFPRRRLELAHGLARDLAAPTGGDPLLVDHDLHYDNVLAADREPWLAVDPKVLAGDPEYQTAQLLWTRLDEMDGPAELLRHFHALVDAAGLSPDLARAWTVVRCADYLLWGLAAGFTEDPRRCAAILDAFAGRRA
ncbi:aminoglycoside phosphotransferase family protein [Phytomonospora sp. NPDC050363]|uniref:aminoglycoside phosphotransferase family protein n=1 Tax=Phytomonospora sp. NPDC050363 TaxID=3155642 RepID=UPI0033C7AC9F